ncbi:MAG: Flp pilus assembly complex ATPase component TadA [Candidatus Cloacimonetes bacterium]|nr:Flp pilus assembly complex ATPase component TadA [Candidatus Cloacimonadota bacterium]
MLKFSRFGIILVQKEIITKATLEKALEIQSKEDPAHSRGLAEILVSEFNVEHDKIYSLLAKLYAFRTIDINKQQVDDNHIEHIRNILDKIQEDFRKELLVKKILPFHLSTGHKSKLSVLAANPTDKSIEKIPLYTEYKKYEVMYCKVTDLDALIARIFPQEEKKNEYLNLIEESDDEVVNMNEMFTEEKEGVDEYELDDAINSSVLVNLYEGAIVEAVRKGASDLHIIPYKKSSVDFFFRIDGKLQLWHRQNKTSPEAISAVVKDRTSGVDRFERDTAQDGFAQRYIDGRIIRFRVSIMPITSSEFERRFESVVIRVIDDRNVITDFRKLGFQEKAEKDFFNSINKSKGIVLVTGPTGSGKSTTLMAALYHVIDPSVNVLTCEDPVEYAIEGARQLKIGNKLSFEQAIRSILRHDPDIVMVGEIRDKITAETAIKLANTGHLTFSTLHTNDAPSAISRLFKMGVETFLLAYAMNIIIAQRLVRKLCKFCKRPLSEEKYQAALDLGLTQEDIESGKIYEAVGCSKCTNGYKSRLNICEALYFTPEVRKAIVESGDEIDEDAIRKIAEGQGMLSMLDSGIDRIRHGLTSIEEIAYAVSED